MPIEWCRGPMARLAPATHSPRMHVRSSGGLGRALVGLRVRLLRRKLDAALAQGADPWSSPLLIVRAGQITAHAHRMRVADALDAVVEIAGRPVAALEVTLELCASALAD